MTLRLDVYKTLIPKSQLTKHNCSTEITTAVLKDIFADCGLHIDLLQKTTRTPSGLLTTYRTHFKPA